MDYPTTCEKLRALAASAARGETGMPAAEAAAAGALADHAAAFPRSPDRDGLRATWDGLVAEAWREIVRRARAAGAELAALARADGGAPGAVERYEAARAAVDRAEIAAGILRDGAELGAVYMTALARRTAARERGGTEAEAEEGRAVAALLAKERAGGAWEDRRRIVDSAGGAAGAIEGSDLGEIAEESTPGIVLALSWRGGALHEIARSEIDERGELSARAARAVNIADHGHDRAEAARRWGADAVPWCQPLG